MVCNMLILFGEELLSSRLTPKLEDHPLSFVRCCLFNVFAASLHSYRPSLLPQRKDAPSHGDRRYGVLRRRFVTVLVLIMRGR
jgi:hypothetical protein